MSNTFLSSAYATATEADSYLSGRSETSFWTALSSAKKGELLCNASMRLDLCMNWNGTPVSETQVLQWPRKDAKLFNGTAIAENVVPTCVKIAAIEEALRMSRPEFSAAEKLKAAGISGTSVGNMKVSLFADNGYICLNALLSAKAAGTPRPYHEVTGGMPMFQTGRLQRD